ncbi:MAG: ECF transporter S component [Clostridia bacterium]|nr:ECF transporter S component [Oscillospiraceae bacterium]MBQ8275132.1 ECF transporter S component [Clostridia bacterium]
MKNGRIKRMVGMAFLIAMIIVLQLIGGIIPPIGGVSISLVLIPIVVGAAVFGPSGGAILGAAFGVIVYIACVNGTDPGGAMVFQANPWLCFIVVLGKGILAGALSGLVYRLLKARNVNGYLAMLMAAIVCPVVNTGVFLACMAMFYGDVLTAWANGSPVLTYVLSSLVLLNFVPELVLNVIFSPAGERIVKEVK